jgi:hypothetical protein
MSTSEEDRLARLIHYIVRRCEAHHELGAVKLYKVLWFSDLAAFRRTGRSLTGATEYRKLQHGPVPFGVGRALQQLEREQKIRPREVNTPAGVRRELLWLVEPDITAFSATDIDIVNQVIEWVCAHTAEQISLATHDALWDEVQLKDPIPIAAAAFAFSEPTEDDIDWATNAIATLG